MSTYYAVRMTRDLGWCECEATDCMGTGVLEKRTRDMIVTEEQYKTLPKNQIDATKSILTHKIGKPVCERCQIKIRKQHTIIRVFEEKQDARTPINSEQAPVEN